jgi:hypothetical protein
MTITNKIVTSGFGKSRGATPGRASIVSQGFGGPPSFVTAAIKEAAAVRRYGGGGGTKRRLHELEEVIVWARLVHVNDKPIDQKIEGFVKVHVNKSQGYASVIAEHVSSRVRAAWEDVKITINRIK